MADILTHFIGPHLSLLATGNSTPSGKTRSVAAHNRVVAANEICISGCDWIVVAILTMTFVAQNAMADTTFDGTWSVTMSAHNYQNPNSTMSLVYAWHFSSLAKRYAAKYRLRTPFTYCCSIRLRSEKIVSPTRTQVHVLTSFAKVDGSRIFYPQLS